MKIRLTPFVALWIAFFSVKVMADETHERMYLTQIINQLDSIKPLIASAIHEQSDDVRIKFHYTSYRDSNGTLHNGLLEDINEIQKGIKEKLNQQISEPRHFVKIRGDYFQVKDMYPEMSNVK